MSSRHLQKGFTLIEIVVSLAVMAVILVVYNVMISNTIFATSTKNRDVALKIANNKMEELRDLGYAGLPVSGTFSDTLLLSLPAGALGSLAVTTYNASIKQVTVTVAWREPSATTTVELNTLVVNNGGL